MYTYGSFQKSLLKCAKLGAPKNDENRIFFCSNRFRYRRARTSAVFMNLSLGRYSVGGRAVMVDGNFRELFSCPRSGKCSVQEQWSAPFR